MKRLLWAVPATVALLSVLPGPASAALTLEREFRYGPERFELVRDADGTTRLEMPLATRDFTPGRPDLPLMGETVELPPATRLVRVELLALETAPLASSVRLPSTRVLKPGLGPVERTAPDASVYSHAGFLPEAPVVPGGEGFERGRHVATLQVSPARWDPASGALERVSRLRVRLVLEPSQERPVERERIVPEWEDASGAATAVGRTAGSLAVRPQGSIGPFVPTQVPSVLGSAVAYVIVTNDALAPIFQQLADWKTQKGIPAVVRTTSFIRQQYPFGADDADRIRMFIRDAYSRWGTKYVLLGGDTDVIPVRYAYTTFYGGENIATDLYYSCLDGNWNADGDSLYGEGYFSTSIPGDAVDLYPEVYVGRAPASNATEAQRFVDKTLFYEKNVVADYVNSVLFFAEVLFPQDWIPGQATSLDGAELIDYDVLPVLDAVPWLHIVRLYENYTDARWRPGALPENRATVLDSLNRGYNVAVHVGHGYRNAMHVGDANISNEDALGLTNGTRYINMYAINCTSAAIDFPSIGEAIMHAPNGGAVTNIGSTRFDFPTAGRAYQQEYFSLLYVDSMTSVGEAQARQKLPFVGFSTYDGVNRWTQMTLLLLGDPELRIFTATPRTLQVTHPASVLVSDTSLAVNVMIGGVPLEAARVTAYKAGDELEIGATDAAGNVTLPFRPDSTGTLVLTVTGFNARPYQATLAVTASGLSALSERPPTLVDDGTGGTSGNGNGLWDAGEIVEIRMPVRNNGGSTASSVVGTLTSTDGLVTILQAAASYGPIVPGATVTPAAGFRVGIPYTAPDQREVPFVLWLSDGAGRSYRETFQLTLRAPEPRHYAHTVVDLGGNSDGRPDPGETVNLTVQLRNMGTGIARSLSARLRSPDGLCAISDSTSSFGDLAPGQEAAGDAFTYVPASSAAKLQLVLSDLYGEIRTQTLDLVYPAIPVDILGVGAASSITLTWARVVTPDLYGYNIYRSLSQAGPFTKVNPVPTDRIAYYQDGGLQALTRYYYRVSSVDSSGNESALSPVQFASTNPPTHAIFPIPTGRNTPAPVAVDHLYPGYPMDIVAGSDLLYVWHPDGTAPVDADGSGATSGDFTALGSYYAGGPSIADIDGGSKEVISATWDDNRLWVYDLAGQVKPGWPAVLLDAVWSGVAVGDLLGNGQKALVLGSNGSRIYAFRANGTEWRDGDSNPTTLGVFKTVGSPYNYGTPALAPIEGGSTLDIVYGSFDGWLYVWRPDGSNVPGFPQYLGAAITGSVAVGSLDGPAGQPNIVAATAGDSLFVFRPDGQRRTGFPVWVRTSGTSKTPSPALADMNNDGYLDIVIASTNGALYVWNRSGFLQAPWSNKRYSTLTGAASESSPVVADINGDGVNDVVIGDENGQLAALSGVDGSMMPGFPIQTEAEIRGVPAVCDLDGDGKTELVVAGWDRNVYVWDYDFPFSPNGPPPWPQFHHDAARTGYASAPVFVDVEDGAADALPRSLEFAPPAPNPARSGARFSWGVPAARVGERLELAIYDLSGRRVRMVEQGVGRSGRYSASWDLRDESGAQAGAGIYFARFTLGAESQSRKLVIVR